MKFKVTMTFICEDMIDEESFLKDFNSDAMACYKFITDDFTDSVYNFCDEGTVEKVEVIND
jgi:hypothetical protein